MIVNDTQPPIHTVEMQSDVFPRIDLAPSACDWELQMPGATRVVPWSSVSGYATGGTSYRVYWFQVDTNADRFFRSGPAHIVRVNP